MQVTRAMVEAEAHYRTRLFQYERPMLAARDALSVFHGPLFDEKHSDARKFAAKVLRHARNVERHLKPYDSAEDRSL